MAILQRCETTEILFTVSLTCGFDHRSDLVRPGPVEPSLPTPGLLCGCGLKEWVFLPQVHLEDEIIFRLADVILAFPFTTSCGEKNVK